MNIPTQGNFFSVNITDNKLIPGLAGVRGPLDKVILQRADLFNLYNTKRGFKNAVNIPELVKFVSEASIVTNKKSDSVVLPIMIKPKNDKKLYDLLEVTVHDINNGKQISKTKVNTLTDDKFTLDVSNLEVGNSYSVHVGYSKEGIDEYTVITSDGYENYFDKIGHTVTVKVEEEKVSKGKLFPYQNTPFEFEVGSSVGFEKFIKYEEFKSGSKKEFKSGEFTGIYVELFNPESSRILSQDKEKINFYKEGKGRIRFNDMFNIENYINIDYTVKPKAVLVPEPEAVTKTPEELAPKKEELDGEESGLES